MLQSEFETLTGIYPSSNLYEAIEQEYMDGNWKDKQTFCAAYKENKDGLAEKIQRAANDAIWRTEEKHRKAMAENSTLVQKLHEEKNALSEELADREKYCEMLREKQEQATEIIQNLNKDKSALSAALKELNIRISQMQKVDPTKLKAKTADVIFWMHSKGYDSDSIYAVITAFSKLEAVMRNG